jgi:hydrogenase maturation protease
MAQVLIIGYGNPLRGDDGLGWHAAQRCAAMLAPSPVNVVACHQLTPELAEPISQAGLVIFLDADTRGPPGQLSCRSIVAQPSEAGVFSHHLTPQTLLACAQVLYAGDPRAMVLSISGADFGYGECLSPAVRTALPELLQYVQALVAAVERGDILGVSTDIDWGWGMI